MNTQLPSKPQIDNSTACIFPDDILKLIMSQVDPHTLLSIAPLVSKRISKWCISSIKDKDSGTSFLYVRMNVKDILGIAVPDELVLTVLTNDSDPIIGRDNVYLIRIVYSTNHLTNASDSRTTQFLDHFGTLDFKSLKCLMLPKMPPRFGYTENVIGCHRVEKLCVEHSARMDYLHELTSVKDLHVISNDSAIFNLDYFPPNLERLFVYRSIGGHPSSSNIRLLIFADNCKKLNYIKLQLLHENKGYIRTWLPIRPCLQARSTQASPTLIEVFYTDDQLAVCDGKESDPVDFESKTKLSGNRPGQANVKVVEWPRKKQKTRVVEYFIEDEPEAIAPFQEEQTRVTEIFTPSHEESKETGLFTSEDDSSESIEEKTSDDDNTISVPDEDDLFRLNENTIPIQMKDDFDPVLENVKPIIPLTPTGEKS